MFEINKLKWNCFKHNFKSNFVGFFKKLQEESNPTLVTSLIISSIVLAILLQFADWKNGNVFAGISCVMMIVELILGVLNLVTTFEDFSYSVTEMSADLELTPIEETRIKLPYGAKLKLLEAVESKIFARFVLAHPRVKETTHLTDFSFKLKPTSSDPAILGTAIDGRMYMITYWDIKNDVDMAEESIEKYKRFKTV